MTSRATTARLAEPASDPRLQPDEAERLASQYVPVWQMGEFSPSTGASSPKGEVEEPAAAAQRRPESDVIAHLGPVVQALALSSVVRPARAVVAAELPLDPRGEANDPASVRATATSDPDSLLPVSLPADPPPAPEQAVETGPWSNKPSPSPDPRTDVNAFPLLQRRKPSQSGAALASAAQTSSLSTAEEDLELLIRPSKKGPVIAIAGVAAVLVILAGFFLTRGGASFHQSSSTPTTLAAAPLLPQPTEESRIPPPPPVVETPSSPDTPVSAVPAESAPARAMRAPAPLPRETNSVAPAPAQRADTRTPRKTPSVPRGTTKATPGGIVRDNPF